MRGALLPAIEELLIVTAVGEARYRGASKKAVLELDGLATLSHPVIHEDTPETELAGLVHAQAEDDFDAGRGKRRYL